VVVTEEDGTVVGLVSSQDLVRRFGEQLRKLESGE